MADFVFMHRDGGACYVDIGWDAVGGHPFHIVDGPITRAQNRWESSGGTIIRELTESDREEWHAWNAWIQYKSTPDGRMATDEVAIAACERDGALVDGDQTLGLPPLQAFVDTGKRGDTNLDFKIPDDRFNNIDYIKKRLSTVESSVSGSLKSTLSFLYILDGGPINLPKNRLKISEPFLEPRELVLVRWLQTRTNGSLRSKYGSKALLAARSAKYKCITCGFADIRALHLDHVNGHVKETDFACLCANCHNIKSRACDWSGERRYGVGGS